MGSDAGGGAANDSGDDEHALPWLSLQRNSQLTCSPQAQSALRQEVGPLNLVMVCGRLRTGKSYLLNALMRRRCFGVSDQARSFTKGVDISSKFLSLQDLGGNSNNEEEPQDHDQDQEEEQQQRERATSPKIVFADLEGQGDKGISQDVKVAVPVLLVSKAVIFMEVCPTGPSKESVLESLQVMIQAANYVANRQQRKQIFGSLHVVLRDCHQSEAECHEILFAQEDEAEAETDEHVKAIRARNEVRRALSLAFERPPQVWCLPKLLSKDAPTDYREASKEFREKIDALRTRLLEQLATPKLLDGQPLTGSTVAALMPLLAETLKSDAPSLNPTSLMQRVAEAESRRALDDEVFALKSAQERLREELPVAQSKLQSRLQSLRAKCRGTLQEKLIRLGATEEGCAASLAVLEGEFDHLLQRVCLKNENLLTESASQLQQDVITTAVKEYRSLRERWEHWAATTPSSSSSSSRAFPPSPSPSPFSSNDGSELTTSPGRQSYESCLSAYKESCREIREAAHQQLQSGLCDLPPTAAARIQVPVEATCDSFEELLLMNFESTWKLKEAEDKRNHYRRQLVRGGLLLGVLKVVGLLVFFSFPRDLAKQAPQVAFAGSQGVAQPSLQEEIDEAVDAKLDGGLVAALELTDADVEAEAGAELADSLQLADPHKQEEVEQEKEEGKEEGKEGKEDKEERSGTASGRETATLELVEPEKDVEPEVQHDLEGDQARSRDEPWIEAMWEEDSKDMYVWVAQWIAALTGLSLLFH